MAWVLKKTWNLSLPYLVKLLAELGQEAQGWGIAQPRRWAQRGRAGHSRMGGRLQQGASKFKVPRWPGLSSGFGPDVRATRELGEGYWLINRPAP